MNLTQDNPINPIIIENVDWFYIEKALSNINPITKAFFILTDPISGSYIQCAGGVERLCAEIRVIANGKFKHYFIGKEVGKNPYNVIWTQIDCRIGPIRIHTTEVLNILDAQKLFNSFLTDGTIPTSYNLRNVTRQFS